MTQLDRLTIGEIEQWRKLPEPALNNDCDIAMYARCMYFSKQLLDTMRENQRLRETLRDTLHWLETGDAHGHNHRVLIKNVLSNKDSVDSSKP